MLVGRAKAPPAPLRWIAPAMSGLLRIDAGSRVSISAQIPVGKSPTLRSSMRSSTTPTAMYELARLRLRCISALRITTRSASAGTGCRSSHRPRQPRCVLDFCLQTWLSCSWWLLAPAGRCGWHPDSSGCLEPRPLGLFVQHPPGHSRAFRQITTTTTTLT